MSFPFALGVLIRSYTSTPLLNSTSPSRGHISDLDAVSGVFQMLSSPRRSINYGERCTLCKHHDEPSDNARSGHSSVDRELSDRRPRSPHRQCTCVTFGGYIHINQHMSVTRGPFAVIRLLGASTLSVSTSDPFRTLTRVLGIRSSELN